MIPPSLEGSEHDHYREGDETLVVNISSRLEMTVAHIPGIRGSKMLLGLIPNIVILLICLVVPWKILLNLFLFDATWTCLVLRAIPKNTKRESWRVRCPQVLWKTGKQYGFLVLNTDRCACLRKTWEDLKVSPLIHLRLCTIRKYRLSQSLKFLLSFEHVSQHSHRAIMSAKIIWES